MDGTRDKPWHRHATRDMDINMDTDRDDNLCDYGWNYMYEWMNPVGEGSCRSALSDLGSLVVCVEHVLCVALCLQKPRNMNMLDHEHAWAHIHIHVSETHPYAPMQHAMDTISNPLLCWTCALESSKYIGTGAVLCQCIDA
jgi:hypothetical protein